MRRAPTSMATIWAISPLRMRDILVVPPPMSTSSTVLELLLEMATAPEPNAASKASCIGPADAQMKRPDSSEKYSRMGCAFSFLSASPVMTTAPVSTSSGVKPASL